MTLTPTFTPATLEVTYEAASIDVTTGITVARDYVERPAYEGSYEITPSAEAQTLVTKNLRMTDNVTIAPIPQNYGLITWDGSTITVSLGIDILSNSIKRLKSTSVLDTNSILLILPKSRISYSFGLTQLFK